MEGRPIPRVSKRRFIQAVQDGHIQRLKQQYGLDGSLSHFIRFNNNPGQNQSQPQKDEEAERKRQESEYKYMQEQEQKAYQEYRHFIRRLNLELKHRQGIGWFGDTI